MIFLYSLPESWPISSLPFSFWIPSPEETQISSRFYQFPQWGGGVCSILLRSKYLQREDLTKKQVFKVCYGQVRNYCIMRFVCLTWACWEPLRLSFGPLDQLLFRHRRHHRIIQSSRHQGHNRRGCAKAIMDIMNITVIKAFLALSDITVITTVMDITCVNVIKDSTDTDMTVVKATRDITVAEGFFNATVSFILQLQCILQIYMIVLS